MSPDQAIAEEVTAETPPRHWRRRRREEVIEEILARRRDGGTLLGICRMPHLPSRSQLQIWIAEDPSLREAFESARTDWRAAIEDECIDLADQADYGLRNVEALKLRVWTRLQLVRQSESAIQGGGISRSRRITVQIVGIEPRSSQPRLAPPDDEDRDGLIL